LADSRGTVRRPGIYLRRHDSDTGDILRAAYQGFEWSHAWVFSLASSVTLGTITGSIAVGFLLDKVDTQIPIVASAALTTGSLLFASQADLYFLY
jgi:hypothetical protein